MSECVEMKYDGVQFYFIDNEYYFAGDRSHTDISTRISKNSYSSQRRAFGPAVIGFRPDIVHCHDWQTGLVPVYLKDNFHEGGFYREYEIRNDNP